MGAVCLCATYSEQAESHFEAAGGHDSDQPEVLLIIGVAYAAYDAQMASLYLDRYIAAKSEDGSVDDAVFETIARALVKSGMPDRALDVLNQGLKKFPNSMTLLVASITVAIAMEDFSLARKTLNKTRKIAKATRDFEALQVLSRLEMALAFQDIGGSIDEFRGTGKPFFGKPF